MIETPNTVWVAVRVWRGLLTDVRAFKREDSARRQERAWRRCMDPQADETRVTRVIVRSKKGTAGRRRSPQ